MNTVIGHRYKYKQIAYIFVIFHCTSGKGEFILNYLVVGHCNAYKQRTTFLYFSTILGQISFGFKSWWLPPVLN